jgi:hypothetical protein
LKDFTAKKGVTNLKLSEEEKLAFDKIKAISRRDPKFLKDVFICLLKMVTLETYKSLDNSFVFYIPYLCGIKASYQDKIKYTAEGNIKGQYVDIKLEAIPSESFISEIQAMSEGEETPSERYIKKQIIEKFAQLLDIEDELEIED